MADYDTTYSFASQSGSDTGWDYWNTDTGDHSVAAENTDQYWCWTDSGSTSSSTGPPSGTDCIYTETSSPTAVGDVYTMTLTTDLDASEYGFYMTVDTCSQGDSAGTLYLEVYDGSDWVEEDSWSGDTTTTFTSRGPYNFSSYDNTDFNIRFRVVVGGTTYWNDFSVTNIRIYGDYKTITPAITNCGDEDHYVGETGVTITGTGFQTDGANSRVRIDSSAAGTGTSQTQTDTSWADTSINFTVSQGSLSYGTNYLFVRNHTDEEENATGYSINLYQNLTTSGLNDTTIYDGLTGIEISGTGFNATQGDSEVYLCDSSDGSGTNVVQTVTAWGATKVTFTVDEGTLSEGTVYVIVGRDVASLGDTVERLSPSQTATLGAVPSAPEIDSVNQGTVAESHEGVTVTGSLFEATQGTGVVEVCPTSTYSAVNAEEQIVNTWSATEIDIDMVRGSLSLGTLYMFVTNDTGDRTISGFPFIMVADPITDGLYKTTSFQNTINDNGLTTTVFLISDE